jgi:uncharacterized protein YkwD
MSSAAADPLSAVNWSRSHGCGAPSSLVPLQGNARLQQAAKLLAGGTSLNTAVSQAGYLAAQSFAIHISGTIKDADLERVLAAHYCRSLQEGSLRDFAAQRQGDELWMILAAPVTLPTPAEASAIARLVLSLTNEARAGGRRCGAQYFAPVAPLILDDALNRAALAHSIDMAAHDEFEHRGHDGSTPAVRVQSAGFGEHRIVGENIAAGAITAAEVVRGWLQSPGHCQNIMDGRFTHMGVGYAENVHTASLVFWTQDFAAHH